MPWYLWTTVRFPDELADFVNPWAGFWARSADVRKLWRKSFWSQFRGVRRTQPVVARIWWKGPEQKLGIPLGYFDVSHPCDPCPLVMVSWTSRKGRFGSFNLWILLCCLEEAWRSLLRLLWRGKSGSLMAACFKAWCRRIPGYPSRLSLQTDAEPSKMSVPDPCWHARKRWKSQSFASHSNFETYWNSIPSLTMYCAKPEPIADPVKPPPGLLSFNQWWGRLSVQSKLWSAAVFSRPQATVLHDASHALILHRSTESCFQGYKVLRVMPW